MLEIDMLKALEGDPEATNFHVLLIQLFLKADARYYRRLKSAFPNTEKVVGYWKETGEILVAIPYEDE